MLADEVSQELKRLGRTNEALHYQDVGGKAVRWVLLAPGFEVKAVPVA